MPILPGDIMCVKTTGERVCVLGFTLDQEGELRVRRPVIGDGGTISHEKITLNDFEIETITEHAKRQVAEMILKSEAQKDLIVAEKRMQAELDADEALTTTPARPVDPTVN
jgi:hypothetical protein